MSKLNLKRILLYSLVGSVIVGALLAISFVLLNTWGWIEIRAILTMFIVAVASLCIMACELARTPKGINALPSVGTGLTLITSAMLLAATWLDPKEDYYWESLGCLSTITVATVHVCLLSVATLSGKFKWIYYIAVQLIYGLAIMVSLIILNIGLSGDGAIQTAAALAIVCTAITLIIPILSRISRAERPNELLSPIELRYSADIDEEISLLRKRIVELEKLKVKMAR